MTEPPLLDIVVVRIRDTTRLLLVGELDLASCPQLHAAIARVLGDPAARRIEIDTALLRFCDSTGLATLVAVHRLAADQGVPLQLVEIPARMRRLFQLTGFSRRLGLHP